MNLDPPPSQQLAKTRPPICCLPTQISSTCIPSAVFSLSEHIRNVFKEGELDEEVVVRKFRIPTRHGAIEGKIQSSEVGFYNLERS